MASKLKNFWSILRSQGVGYVVVKILVRYNLYETQIVRARRITNEHVRKISQNTIAYGPFEGVILADDWWWGEFNFASKILGVYELQVLEKLIEFSNQGSLFIDIGAADGFFAIGLLRGGYFRAAVCFEISEKGQDAIRTNAQLNGISGDHIKILGAADPEKIINAASNIDKAIILCDIEGEEFNLFDEHTLILLKGNKLIIELHSHLIKGGVEKRDKLIRLAKRHFKIEVLKCAPVPVGAFDELSHFSDDERLLAFSEGRGSSGEWLILT